jgi:hypothetical protein
MPHGVLNVVRVDRLMQFKLFAPVLKSIRVIERDSSLPVLGRWAGSSSK